MAEAQALKAQGMTHAEIGARVGIGHARVGHLLRKARYEAHLREGTILDGCLCRQCWQHNGPAWLASTSRR
jgi:hypothetical protein